MRKKKYTKEQLIFFLKKLKEKLNRNPSQKDLNKKKLKELFKEQEEKKSEKINFPSSTTYVKRFGSWNNALKKASLLINKKKFTKQELLENLKIIQKEINKCPMPKDLKERKWAGSYSTYKKYFKTWENALFLAKIEKNDFSSLKKFTK